MLNDRALDRQGPAFTERHPPRYPRQMASPQSGRPQSPESAGSARLSARDRFRSLRTRDFTESVIREMTRLAARHGAINLAQGFPDFSAPEALKQAARDAISDDFNQYAITWGAKSLRNAIAAKYRRTYGLELDPETEITVCCGSTEGMIASLTAVTNPGDEVVIFEPFYENYGPDTKLCGAVPRFERVGVATTNVRH